jgi:Na+/H+-dicarboxylate symporter
MLSVFRSLPVRLFIGFAMGLICASYFAPLGIQFFYSLSVFLKDFLVFILPFVVFSYLTFSLISFAKKGPMLILGVVLMFLCSNMICVSTSLTAAHFALPFVKQAPLAKIGDIRNQLDVLFRFPIPQLLRTDLTMLSAVILGIGINFLPNKEKWINIISKMKSTTTFVLQKGFIPCLPLYIFGFVLKLQYDGVMKVILNSYVNVFFMTFALAASYLLFWYFVAASFSIKRMLGFLKEMLPPSITAFSTMSSAATMPLTLRAVEKNTGNAEYAGFVVPLTMNPHMTGDNLAIPFMGMTLLYMLGGTMPDIQTLVPLVIYFCLAKFSAAGVPGGGMLVTLPVIEKYLGLSPEGVALLATLYILQDSIWTMVNVVGNGAFSIISFKVFKKMFKKETEQNRLAA